MTCDFDRIDALCAGELPDGERASVLRHMESCPACRAYYEALASLEGKETAPEGFTARVMDAVRATPQVTVRRTRRLWQSVAAMAACAALVVGLGLNSGMFSAETAPEAESAPADLIRSSEESPESTAPSDNLSQYSDQASDLPLTIHTLTDEALCHQVRAWLAQQNIPELYPNGAREAYDLTADQVTALNRHIPLLALPEMFLQLELKAAG